VYRYRNDLTAEYVRAILDYDPKNGNFYWRVRRKGRRPARPGSLAGYLGPYGYWLIGIDGECYLAHRLAWLWMTGNWPENQIDHIDMDRKNNIWINLRQSTFSQNNYNKNPRASRAGLKGISLVTGYTNKWKARVWVDGKELHLGVFDSVETAHAAYREAAQFHYGDYARMEPEK
jgi:HNH endonuclease